MKGAARAVAQNSKSSVVFPAVKMSSNCRSLSLFLVAANKFVQPVGGTNHQKLVLRLHLCIYVYTYLYSNLYTYIYIHI